MSSAPTLECVRLVVTGGTAITLIAEDGFSKITVDCKIALKFPLVKSFYEDRIDSDSDGEVKEVEELKTPMPLRISKDILKKVILFAQHEEFDPFDLTLPLRSMDMSNLVPRWYSIFITQFDLSSLLCLMDAAQYLQYQPLLRLTCLSWALYVATKLGDNATISERGDGGLSPEFTGFDAGKYWKCRHMHPPRLPPLGPTELGGGRQHPEIDR